MLTIPRSIYDQMLAALQRAYPLEGCGFLAGYNGRVERLYPVDNLLQTAGRFAMAPRQQVEALLAMEERGLNLLAIYHSHPQGPAHPSPLDLAEITFPEAAQVIVSLADCRSPVVHAFKIDGQAAHQIPLQVQP